MDGISGMNLDPKALEQMSTEDLVAMRDKLMKIKKDQAGAGLSRALLGGIRGYTEGKVPTFPEMKQPKMEREPLAGLESAPEGYEFGYDKAGKKILQPTKAPKDPTSTEQFRIDLQQIQQRVANYENVEDAFAELQLKYPEKNLEKIKERFAEYTPEDAESPLRKGTSFLDKATPWEQEGEAGRIEAQSRIESLDAPTRESLDQIKTKADLEELKRRRAEFEARGVDVDSILEILEREIATP